MQNTAQAQGVSLWQAACAQGSGGRTGGSVAAFVQLIEKLRMETQALPLPEIVEQLLQASGLIAHYSAERDGQDRVDNLNELVNAAAAFVREAREAVSVDGGHVASAALTEFLAHAALEAGDTQTAEGRPALQLMTVHSAKGLEFDTVFVTGLEEGLFPHDNSLHEDGGLEEERRLMYVALTRARRRLYLTYAQTRMLHGQTRYAVASRYFDEIPSALLQWLSPSPAAMRSDYLAREPEPATTRSALRRSPPASVPRVGAVHGFRIGQSVRHNKFGLGVIVDAEGNDGDARLQVNFHEAGVKWLSLEYAKLTPA
jgi:DNA helicase-2/ATP-dependent DNA helicase PcrA